MTVLSNMNYINLVTKNNLKLTIKTKDLITVCKIVRNEHCHQFAYYPYSFYSANSSSFISTFITIFYFMVLSSPVYIQRKEEEQTNC